MLVAIEICGKRRTGASDEGIYHFARPMAEPLCHVRGLQLPSCRNLFPLASLLARHLMLLRFTLMPDLEAWVNMEAI